MEQVLDPRRARRAFLAWIVIQALVLGWFAMILAGSTETSRWFFFPYASVGQVLSFGYGGGPIRCGSVPAGAAAAYVTRMAWFYLPILQLAGTLLVLAAAWVLKPGVRRQLGPGPERPRPESTLTDCRLTIVDRNRSLVVRRSMLIL